MGLKFDMIGLFSANLPAMVAFYRDVLGLHTEQDGSEGHAEFQHEGIRFALYDRAFVTDHLGHPVAFPSGVNGTFELAIDLPRFEDVDVEYARLVAAGAKPISAPRQEPWGMRSSYVADPDGNLLEIGSWNKGAKA